MCWFRISKTNKEIGTVKKKYGKAANSDPERRTKEGIVRKIVARRRKSKRASCILWELITAKKESAKERANYRRNKETAPEVKSVMQNIKRLRKLRLSLVKKMIKLGGDDFESRRHWEM